MHQVSHNVVHSCTHDSPELSKDLSGASIVPQMVETQPWISCSRPVNVKLYLRSASVDMHGLWFSEHLQIQVQTQVKPLFQYQRRNPPLAPHRPIADDGQIWAPTTATGSSQAHHWLQASKSQIQLCLETQALWPLRKALGPICALQTQAYDRWR